MKKAHEPIPCAHCGRMFVPYHGTQIYCSKACSLQVVYAKNRQRYAALTEEQKAKRAEYQREHRTVRYEWCKVCGAKFEKKHNMRYCSDKCRKTGEKAMQAAYMRRRYKSRQPREIVCKACGKPFIGKWGVKYCTDCCPDRFYENRTLNLEGAFDNVPV